MDQKNTLKLIDSAKSISKFKNIEFGFKLQFRDLKTFLHVDSIKSGNKHVKRFLDTKLSENDYMRFANM